MAAVAADGPQISLEQSDGTPDWNWQDDSSSNGIVRTNDLITYTVHLTANDLMSDTAVTIDLPQGEDTQSHSRLLR